MSTNSAAIKSALLGENVSTAMHKLRKRVLFRLIAKLHMDECFRCGSQIETVEELSIEHKEAWQSAVDPAAVFWDLDNIAFSHLSCNVGAAARWNKYETEEERKTARSLSNARAHRVRSESGKAAEYDNRPDRREKRNAIKRREYAERLGYYARYA